MNFEEERDGNGFLKSSDGRIEAFEMTDLKYAPAFFGQPGETHAGLRGCGDWLFDENIDTGVKQARGDILMSGGGSGDDCRVDVVYDFVQIGVRSGAVLRSDSLRARHRGVDDSAQLHIGYLADHANVISAKSAGADNCRLDLVHSSESICGEPTMTIPASFARRIISSLSSSNVRPASTARAVVFVSIMVSMVVMPATGTSKSR